MSEWGINPWYTPGAAHVAASQRDMDHTAMMIEIMAQRARQDAETRRMLEMIRLNEERRAMEALAQMSAVAAEEVRPPPPREMTPDEVWEKLAARSHVDEDTAKKLEAAGQSWDDYWADAG